MASSSPPSLSSQLVAEMKEISERVLRDQPAYLASLAGEWTNTIVSELLAYLDSRQQANHDENDDENNDPSESENVDVQDKRKYIVHVTIVEKHGSTQVGLHAQMGGLLERQDQLIEYRFESKALLCSIFALSIALL
jgi:Tctex-1 family